MKQRSYLATVLMVILTIGCFTSCKDDPDADNFYTTKKEYASDFLKNRPEKFSKFMEVLERATGNPKREMHLMELLATYGSYTLFAPTNEAMDKFLQSKHVKTVAELKKEDCDTLAFTHIMDQAYFTSDYNSGTYPSGNLLDRFLTISPEADTTYEGGQQVIKLKFSINKNAYIAFADDSVKNGVVHTMSNVIDSKSLMIPSLIKEDPEAQIFYQAMEKTGYAGDLQTGYIDLEYENSRSSEFWKDSTDWTNNKLVVKQGNEYDNVAYMKHRYQRYTVFVERDSIFKMNGISNITELESYAKDIYGEGSSDYKDKTNALNRFVAYHILPFQQNYWQLTCVDGPSSNTSPLAKLFSRSKYDIAEWYETMMPHSVMKFSFPSGGAAGLYINRRGVQKHADYMGVFRPGVKVLPSEDMTVQNTAVNGLYYYVDDIVSYNKDVQDNVIGGERMRVDATTLSPDFMNSGARGHYSNAQSLDNGKYGNNNQGANATSNSSRAMGFLSGFTKNVYFSDNVTHVHVRNRVLSFWSYEGDEVIFLGRFNFVIKMPPVPEGDWELRVFSCVGFDNRGIVQYFFGTGHDENGKFVRDNMAACGIPQDMRYDGEKNLGWLKDAELGEEDVIATFDRNFRNRGWMKGMDCYGCSSSPDPKSAKQQTQDGLPYTNRQVANCLRKIITRFHSDGKSDYYLQCQQRKEDTNATFALDCIELCPSSVYNNADFPEDKM